MKRATRPPALTLALAAGVAAVVAFAANIGLRALAEPTRLPERIAAVDAGVGAVSGTLRGRALDPAYPVDAVCAQDPAQASATLKASVASAVNAAGLQVSDVAVAAPVQNGGELATLRLRLEATGSYEAAVGAVAALSAVRPLVVVDTADLVSNTSAVTLTLTGRAFCSAGN